MYVNACSLCGGDCLGCMYSDLCGLWNDTDICNIPQIEVSAEKYNQIMEVYHD